MIHYDREVGRTVIIIGLVLVAIGILMTLGDKLPIKLSGATIESVALCAFGLVLVSILYPARKASQMDPVQAIRYG
jgi:ABC-type antimicrobial peptide transport system permease subunit